MMQRTQLARLLPVSATPSVRPVRPGAHHPLLLQHGHTCLAYSMVADPTVHSFVGRRGVVLYGQIQTLLGQRTLVCGDPLCEPQDLRPLLQQFLARFGGASFWQIGQGCVDALAELGYEWAQLGVETRVDLRRWSPSGRHQQNLRTAHNRARREGLEIVEAECEALGAERLHALSRRWMGIKTLKRHELSFLARPARYVHEPGVRKFFALRHGRPEAFVFFDPMYRGGEPFGYAANILRHEPDAPNGVCDAVIVEAALRMQREGVHELNLGMLPFCPSQSSSGPRTSTGAEVARFVIDTNWRRLNGLFHFQGIAFHKRRWNADEVPVYYAGLRRTAVPDFYAVARMVGVL